MGHEGGAKGQILRRKSKVWSMRRSQGRDTQEEIKGMEHEEEPRDRYSGGNQRYGA
jgi:hypothetical protein